MNRHDFMAVRRSMQQAGYALRQAASRATRHRLWLVLAAAPLLIVPQMVSATPSKTELELENDHQIVQWSGVINRDGPRAPQVPECQNVSCDHLKLEVDLPKKVRVKPGGVLVGIRIVNSTFDDNLILVVYKHGTRVAVSNASVASAQSVQLPFDNGTYDVYVVDGITFGDTQPSQTISYQGLTQVRYEPAAQPARQLMPDLVALPQQNVTFDNSGGIFDDPSPNGSSCHQSEIDEDGAQLCLRFDQVLGNIGEGPLDLRFDQPTGTVPVDGQQVPVSQRVYNSTGGFTDVPAGSVIWHEVHHHYHFVGFAQSKLWASDSQGNRTGSQPVATGNKVSFCIADTAIHPAFWGIKAFAPQSYPAPNCLDPDSSSNGVDHFKQGMSAGWADKYDWFLPGQYIEVTGVSNGDYILDTTVDPASRLIEATKSNNCGSVRVRLTDMGTATPHAQLLGSGPACLQ